MLNEFSSVPVRKSDATALTSDLMSRADHRRKFRVFSQWLCVACLACLALLCCATRGYAADRAALQAELNGIADQVVLPRAYNLIHQLVGPSVVAIHLREQELIGFTWTGDALTREAVAGEGSGFVFAHDPDGGSLLLSNAHVVAQTREDGRFLRDQRGNLLLYDRATISTHDGRMFPAVVRGVDPKTDLAVLHVPSAELPVANWGDSDAVQVGDYVLALGYPFGVGYSATAGIISATDRSTSIYSGEDGVESFLQTDAAINPGNSGGPLVNLSGAIIGVNANIYAPGRTGGNVGLGFAIPANLAKRVALDLADDGSVDWPRIGIQFEQPRSEVLQEIGVGNASAVLVTLVVDQSPAAEAGLQAGDLITQIDGKSVQGLQHVKARLAAAEAGKAIPLEIWRRGSVVTSSVTPILASELNRRLRGTTAPIVTVQGWGFRCTVGSGNRPLVTNVAPQSLAARAGIQTGDLIVGLNVGKGLQAVRQLDDLRRLKQASGRVIIALWRQGRVTTTTVQL